LSKEEITAVKHYGKIPLPTAQYVKPWEEVHLDLIGPWKVRFNSTAVLGKSTTKNIQALTVMDIATTCPEFVAIKNKTSHHIATLFDGDWLYRYPRPAKVVFDNGNEFLGQEFQELLHSYSIKPVPMTVKIPRSNGIIERVGLSAFFPTLLYFFENCLSGIGCYLLHICEYWKIRTLEDS
jgi:hypothetical protein